MRCFSFCLICLITFNVSSQELKKITIRDDFKHTKEEISVLASDKKIKHGVYKLYYDDKLSVEGNYSNNLKDGIWKEYDFKGKTITKEYNYKNDTLHGYFVEFYSGKHVRKSGNYINGLMDGIWEFYDFDHKLFEKGSYSNGNEIGIWEFYTNGDLVQKYNFDNGEFLLDKVISHEKNVTIYDDLKNPIDTIDELPFYLGGIKHLYYFIGNEIEYPRMARDNGIEGTVYVVLNIDESGKIESAKISRGVGGGCDEESIRVLLLTSGKWIPAYDDGKPIEMKIMQPIKFTLSD